MKASVILPVHNKAPWLQECLDSVLAQSFGDFELIAVDDASTDGSLEILAACSDPRLKVIRSERNLGPGLAAQLGMDAAQGEIILRVDADDVQLPERFAAQVAFLDAHPEVGALGGSVQLIGDGEGVRRRPLEPDDCRVELLFNVALFQPTLAVRRKVLLDHAIRYKEEDPWVGEDWILQLRLAAVTELANLDQVLSYYRRQGQGISEGRNKFADLSRLHASALAANGFPDPVPEELELHAWFEKCFHRIPDAAGLVKLRNWMERLMERNRDRGVFPTELFQRRLEQAWDELLYHLPQFGARVTWAYVRMGAHLNPKRSYYLLRAFTSLGGARRWKPD